MIVHSGWRDVELAELLDFRNGINFLRSSAGAQVKILGVGDFGDSESIDDFATLKSVITKSGLAQDDLLKENDLVFVRSNGNRALVGRCVLIRRIDERVTFSGFTIRGRLKTDQVDPVFLSKVLRSDLFTQHLRVHGGGSSISNLSQGVLAAFSFSLPPLPEQRKIAGILRTWDDAIERLQDLMALRQQRYQALANQLTSQLHESTRNPRFLMRLSEVTREITDRNVALKLGRDAIMGVSNRVGLFPMRIETIADEITRYRMLPPRGFAYNPMRINVGSIAMSMEPLEVLVSPDYVSFTCDESTLLPEYLQHVMNTDWWSYQMNASGSGSVRSRIYYDDLAALHLSLPSAQEQTKICEILDTAIRLTALCREEIELLKSQKRGLMQKLLTGDIHVSTDHIAKPREAAVV